jgi:CIC family chloride channel protein
LSEVRIGELFSPHPDTVRLHPDDSLDTVLERLATAPYELLPVVDAQGRLRGVIGLEEAHPASSEPALRSLVLADDLMRVDVRPLTPDNTLDHALELFVESDLSALPVVDGLQQRQLVGMVRRREISSAYLRHIHGPATTD